MGKLKLFVQFQRHCNKREVAKNIYLALALVFITTNAFSKSYSQTILKLNFKEAEIESVISFIEEKTDYRFLYQPSEVNLKRKVNINYSGKITTAVNMLFSGASVYPVIVNKQIILKSKLNVQKRVISGRVVDKDGLPLQDVSVVVNKFERGTITDANGKYSIAAKTGDKISFFFIGFKDKEVVVENGNTINVTLEVDITFLDEVVLVGYGRKEKSKISSAISSIDGQDVQNDLQSGNSFDRSLSGLIKGVRIIQGGGKPGSGVDINIRGYTSPFSYLANNPLFVIDDVPIQAKTTATSDFNPLLSINPNDIESINVLKDAAATSIYGSRGANGVIIIKTKKGTKNQGLKVNLSVKSTFSKPINTLKYLDVNGYKNYVNEVMKVAEQTGNLAGLSEFGAVLDMNTYEFVYDPSQAVFGNANTNWADVVYRNAAHTQEYNLALRGGTESAIYSLSLRYLDQEGLLKADEFKQYNARLNMAFTPTEKWDLGTNISLGTSKNNTGYLSLNNDVNNILSVRPDLAVYDEQGELTSYTKQLPSDYTQVFSNPLGQTTKNFGEVVGKTFTGNVYAQYEILSGLKLKAAVNIAHFISETNNYTSDKYNNSGTLSTANLSSLVLNNSTNTNVVADFTANYSKTFNQKHFLDVLAGISRTREYIETSTNTYREFPNDELRFPQFAEKQEPRIILTPENGLNSYMARASYGYDKRYNITATVRLDQSSRFAPSKRDAWFPSVAASWNIHNEKFISDNNNINALKLRLTYGTTGSTNVPSFTFIQKFVTGDLYNGQTSIGASTTLSNPEAAWEKTKEFNAGLDFGFFQNKITGSVDVYKRKTTGVLIASPFTQETGATSYTSNFASINNKGIEVDLNFGIINNEDFSWSVSLNATKNVNKLISFNASSIDPDLLDYYEVGKEINLIKGYVVEGIYQTQEEIDNLNTAANAQGYAFYDQNIAPGDYKMKDLNGDGRITADDKQILGSSQPDLFGGFRTNLTYKNFSLGASFSYSFGSESSRFVSTSHPIFNANPYINIEQQFAPEHRWSATNTSATLPRIGFYTVHNSRTSTANVYDASYIRFKGVKLGYHLPVTLIEKLGLSHVGFYISGNNLYTWTDFPGIDPEAIGGGVYTGSTSNSDPYPMSKSWTFGVNINF